MLAQISSIWIDSCHFGAPRAFILEAFWLPLYSRFATKCAHNVSNHNTMFKFATFWRRSTFKIKLSYVRGVENIHQRACDDRADFGSTFCRLWPRVFAFSSYICQGETIKPRPSPQNGTVGAQHPDDKRLFQMFTKMR